MTKPEILYTGRPLTELSREELIAAVEDLLEARSTHERLAALDELTAQAQELDMGYGPPEPDSE